jgi:hypothetical protein
MSTTGHVKKIAAATNDSEVKDFFSFWFVPLSSMLPWLALDPS